LFIRLFTSVASPIAAVNKVTRPDPAAAAEAAELAFSTETPLSLRVLKTSSYEAVADSPAFMVASVPIAAVNP
jgi:hypothetical protein